MIRRYYLKQRMTLHLHRPANSIGGYGVSKCLFWWSGVEWSGLEEWEPATTLTKITKSKWHKVHSKYVIRCQCFVIFEPNRALNISTAVKPRKRVDEMSRQICEQFELILRCPDEEKRKSASHKHRKKQERRRNCYYLTGHRNICA